MGKIFRERWRSINWKNRFDFYVRNAVRKLSGQTTSSELIAEALEKGVDRKKLDALIEEMEVFASELELHDSTRAGKPLWCSQNLPVQEIR